MGDGSLCDGIDGSDVEGAVNGIVCGGDNCGKVECLILRCFGGFADADGQTN